jgi:hypothetical protein
VPLCIFTVANGHLHELQRSQPLTDLLFSLAPAPPRARGFAPSPRFARCAVRMSGAFSAGASKQEAPRGNPRGAIR